MTQPKNSLTQQKPRFSVAIQSEMYKNLINSTLGDPNRAARFIASISSAVAVNPMLQDCDAGTILSGALVGESLNLSPSPALGHYYLVPYNDNVNNRKVATMQIGWKGYVQLAIRTGQYKNINVVAIKEGELKSWNPLTEELKVEIIEDDTKRESLQTIGYYAYFELLNGFRKEMYWSKAKMESHATKYSQAYRNKNGSSFWLKDFDQMAFKTMLRQLISKWGIMSADLKVALESDMSVINESGKKEYVDNVEDEVPDVSLAEKVEQNTLL